MNWQDRTLDEWTDRIHERGRRNWTTALVGKYIATLERVAEEETE